MSKIWVKICGITSEVAMRAVVHAGADAGGFVFHAPSPRHLSLERARALAEASGGLMRVGVFVDADDALLAAAIGAARLHVLQLQGSESAARVAEVREKFGLSVWKAVGVGTADEVRQAAALYHEANLLLLDARPGPGMDLPGGNGLRFDWRILEGAAPDLPWGLAGGLDAGNVGQAIRLAGPALVDVSSGVEASPGVKDVAKVAAFVAAARRA